MGHCVIAEYNVETQYVSSALELPERNLAFVSTAQGPIENYKEESVNRCVVPQSDVLRNATFIEYQRSYQRIVNNPVLGSLQADEDKHTVKEYSHDEHNPIWTP